MKSSRRLLLLLVLPMVVSCRSSSSPHCPQSMTFVPSRSTEGRMVYCQTRDEKRSQWVELYEKTGGKRQSCGFAQGQPEGSFTAWHASGKIWVQGQYLAGKKVRLWKQWDEAGALVAEGEYREGRLIGGAPVGGMAGCEAVAK